MRKAALSGMADWGDASPLADLQGAAKNDTDRTNRILAVRGYIRMIGLSGQNPQEKVHSYQEAMGLAERPEEKRQALSGFADVSHVDALKAVEPYLNDADLKNEAYLAYEKIAELLGAASQTWRKTR